MSKRFEEELISIMNNLHGISEEELIKKKDFLIELMESFQKGSILHGKMIKTPIETYRNEGNKMREEKDDRNGQELILSVLLKESHNFKEAFIIMVSHYIFISEVFRLRMIRLNRFEKRLTKKITKIPFGYDILPQDFYQTEEWILRSIEILKRDNWKCQLKGSNCLGIGNIVHHIRSPKTNPQICLDPNNLVCACKKCHEQLYKNYNIKNKK